jgi:hypothetical protein
VEKSDLKHNLPERHGGIDNLIVPVPNSYLEYACNNLVEKDEDTCNVYQEYFQYVVHTLNVHRPEHWREALQLYNQLLNIALDGY